MNWKKSLSIVGTLIMVVGQNIAGFTAFAETISNQESIIEDIYFEKNNTKISEITLEQGKEETITFVDENKEDEEAIVTLPESTKLNLAETNSQLDDASTVNYDQDTNQVKIAFKNKEQNIKRTNLILATNDTVENNQARMYAQVVRLDSQTYMSKPVIITTTSSENNKQQEETQKNEEDGESAQQSSTNGESSNSLETNSLNKEQKNEVENTSNVDSTESTSVEKELQDKEESINKNEESTNRIKREINSAKATGDFSVAPPASNIKITEQFTNNLSGNSNSYISETYPQAAALTPKESWQFGSIWSNYQLDLTKSFEYKSHVYLGERTGSDFNDTTAADGITFTLQNDPRGQGAYGTEGGGLGAYGSGGSVEKPQDYNYIQNALSVELDTWYNGSDRKNDQFDKDIPTEAKNSGHIGIVRPGPGEPGQSKIGHLQYKYDVNSPLADNTWKEFNIIWTPIVENGILKANITYSLGNMSNTYHIEDVKSMFNGTKTYFGFTSSTGQNKIFQGVSIDSLPQRGFVYVNYKDIDTKENIDSEKELSGNLSNKWISEKKDFTNLDYQYVRVDGATSGEFTQDTQYVTYWYRKLLPKIEIKKSVDKETAKVGDELTYTISAKNSGEGNWNGTITDKIPTEYVNLVSGTTTVNGEKVEDNDVWKDNVLNVKQTIKAGESVTITFKVKTIKAAEGQTIANVAETDDPNVPPTPPAETKVPKVELTKTADKANAKVGEEITYTITAKNSGNGDWENGTITDKIPTEYVNLVSGTTTVNGEKVEDNDVWKDNVLNVKQTIKAGESVTITFKVKTIKAAEGQTIANVAETDDPNVPPTPPAETKVPKVELTKTADKANAKVGEEITYTIIAKNSGNGDWENGTITDKIPTEYVNLVSGTTTVNGEKVEDNDVWKDNVLNVKQTIKAGESVTITFKVKTIKAAEGQTIANVAETDDPNVPPTPPAETKVPKVELTKTADKANAKVGEEITYTITAKNSGNGDWENGTITDKIPTEYVNLVSGTTTVNGEKVEDNDVWKDNVLNVKQTIKAGESVTITFKVKTIKAAEGQTIANVAETDDPNVPPTPPAETKVPKVELTKTADKANAKVGEEITYTIIAKNSGNGDWENGTITDKIPTEYVNLVSGTTTVNGEKVEDNDVWKDNVLNVKQTIKAGESVTITFKVKTIKAAEGQTIANVAETDDPNVPPTPPAETKVPKVELTKTADKANAKVGEEITYTITAKNSGNGDWENGTITDKIPTEYVNLVSGTTTVNGEKVEDNDVWKDNVLNVKQTIKAGESVTITFKVKTIKAAEGQTIANVAETDDPNVPPTPPAETKVPKVELTKTADKANAKVGEEITYTITAKNSGNGDWENGTITDKIPTEYVNLVSGTTTVNGEKVEDNDVWKDNVLNVKQTIKAGESVTITFKVKTIKAAEGQTIANVAETDDPNVPPTPPAETKVPKVELTKTADKANAKVGEEITYTITAKNSGNGDWENGTITDKIPTEYVNLVSGTTTVNGEKVEDNDVWKDNVLNVKQTIKAGESVTITFKVKTIKAAEGQTIANVAETDDPNVPPTPPAETKVPKVELTKTADKANAKVGEEITYTITAKNSGNGDWENGTITDKIPTEYVNLVSGTTTVNGEKVEDNDVWKDNVLNVKQTIKAGESVTITFKVKTIKAAEGQTIANVAETDDPNVPPTPPAETKVPIEPTIHKNIEGVQKLVLKNNKQKFNWNITVSFGTNTMNWKQASITDSVNNLLDIVEVTVVDENGKDVTGNGTLSTENNEVVFEINKKDASYTYLARHTYTMTITTKIKGSVTDEDLAPYIKDGGIPNQADLNFGNEGDKKHSEIPTIVPSKGTPPEKTNTPSNQNDKGNLTPSKGIFPHTGENQMLSNILLVVGTCILIILTVYYILKKRRIE